MVNLEYWVGQEVLVTYVNGHTGICKVGKSVRSSYPYSINGYTYTNKGVHYPGSPINIIKIQPMNKKEQLKQQIKALEAELKNLEEAEKVPEGFNEERAYKFLYGNDNGYGELDAIDWGDNTKEGREYWIEISVRNKKPSDKDVIQLQKWIIESYRRKLGLGS